MSSTAICQTYVPSTLDAKWLAFMRRRSAMHACGTADCRHGAVSAWCDSHTRGTGVCRRIDRR